MTDICRWQPKHGIQVHLELSPESLAEFFPMLQTGVLLKTFCLGQSVRAFLTRQLGVPHDYIRQRISTVFLDGMPVDDLNAAMLNHGSRLALSSAMPGLVGATMRQGSPLAVLRDTITHIHSEPHERGEGFIRLKLFNLLMSEIGPLVLRKGIFAQAGALWVFLHEHPSVMSGCRRIQFNGKAVASDDCMAEIRHADAETIELVVLFESNDCRRGGMSHE